MLIGCLLMVLGLVLIVINPFVGVAPGLLLIAVGTAVAILGGFFRTMAGIAGRRRRS